jgi:EpsI family protein
MLGRAMLVVVVLTTSSVVIGRAARTDPVALPVPFARFPDQMGEWQGVRQPALDQKSRETLGADDYLDVVFSAPNQSMVGLFVGYWNSQQQGDTIHSPLNCLPGTGWEPLSKRTVDLSMTSRLAVPNSTISINRYVVRKGLERQMILYWYQSHGRIVASEYWSRFFLVGNAIQTRQTNAAMIRVNTPIIGEASEDEAAAENLAVQFLQVAVPVLDRYLPG